MNNLDFLFEQPSTILSTNTYDDLRLEKYKTGRVTLKANAVQVLLHFFHGLVSGECVGGTRRSTANIMESWLPPVSIREIMPVSRSKLQMDIC